MALQRRTATTGTSDAATSISITKPTGCAAGDVIVIAFNATGSISTVTTNLTAAGFTEFSFAGNVPRFWWKIADGTEGASFTFAWTTSRDVSWACQCWYDDTGVTGVHDVDNAQESASGTSHATPDVTATKSNNWVVCCFAATNAPAAANAWTPPSGMGEDADVTNAGADRATLEISSVKQSAAGATGAKTATSSQTLVSDCAIAVFAFPTTTTLTPSAPNLPLSGSTPALTTTITPTAVALVLTGSTPSVTVATVVTPTAASLVLTGSTPALTATLAPAAKALVITASTPALTQTLTPTAAALVLAGATPDILSPVSVSPTAAALVLAGGTATITVAVAPALDIGRPPGSARFLRNRIGSGRFP